MPTIRLEISPKIIKEALQKAASDEFTSSNPLIYADIVEKGLQLRIQASSISWLLKFNGKTKSLGNLHDIPNVTLARKTAQKVRNLLRENIDTKSFIAAKNNGNSDKEATDKAILQTKRISGKWNWTKLVDEYEAYLSKPKLRNGQLKPPSLRSANNAKNSLNIKEADFLKDKFLSEITAGDLEDIRDNCANQGRKTASRAFVMNAKAALSHAKKMHSGRSGLSETNRWWLEVRLLDETFPAPRTRAPTIKEIVEFLYHAENNRTLKKNKAARSTSENVICGIWFLALTAQRVSASFSLKKANILNHPDSGHAKKGWKVAYWNPEDMKSRRVHAIPLPPKLLLLLERMREAEKRVSQYVFQATSSKDESDNHLDQNSVKNLMSRLRENELINNIEHFTPHDLRRSFATWCSDNLMPDGAASAVLDHALAGETVISADITRQVYDKSQRLNLKAIALEKWTDEIFDEYRRSYKNRNMFNIKKEELWFDKPISVEENRLTLTSDDHI